MQNALVKRKAGMSDHESGELMAEDIQNDSEYAVPREVEDSTNLLILYPLDTSAPSPLDLQVNASTSTSILAQQTLGYDNREGPSCS